MVVLLLTSLQDFFFFFNYKKEVVIEDHCENLTSYEAFGCCEVGFQIFQYFKYKSLLI